MNSQLLPVNPTYGLRLSAQISLAAREDGRFDVAFLDQITFIPEPAATALAFPGILVLMRRRRRAPTLAPRGRRVN